MSDSDTRGCRRKEQGKGMVKKGEGALLQGFSRKAPLEETTFEQDLSKETEGNEVDIGG